MMWGMLKGRENAGSGFQGKLLDQVRGLKVAGVVRFGKMLFSRSRLAAGESQGAMTGMNEYAGQVYGRELRQPNLNK